MVLDDHQVARSKLLVHGTGRIGDQQPFHAEHLEDANWQRAALRRITFVRMKSTLHADHRIVRAIAEHKVSRMSDHRALAEVRNLRVRYGHRVRECARQTAQTGATDDRELRLSIADFASYQFGAQVHLFERVAVEKKSGQRT